MLLVEKIAQAGLAGFAEASPDDFTTNEKNQQ